MSTMVESATSSVDHQMKLQKPNIAEKHIQFNDMVEQCIAVNYNEDSFSDDSDGLFLALRSKPSTEKLQPSILIAKLPSTTLKKPSDSVIPSNVKLRSTEITVSEIHEDEVSELSEFAYEDTDEGIISRAISAASTVKDVASVLWNVRW